MQAHLEQLQPRRGNTAFFKSDLENLSPTLKGDFCSGAAGPGARGSRVGAGLALQVPPGPYSTTNEGKFGGFLSWFGFFCVFFFFNLENPTPSSESAPRFLKRFCFKSQPGAAGCSCYSTSPEMPRYFGGRFGVFFFGQNPSKGR